MIDDSALQLHGLVGEGDILSGVVNEFTIGRDGCDIKAGDFVTFVAGRDRSNSNCVTFSESLGASVAKCYITAELIAENTVFLAYSEVNPSNTANHDYCARILYFNTNGTITYGDKLIFATGISIAGSAANFTWLSCVCDTNKVCLVYCPVSTVTARIFTIAGNTITAGDAYSLAGQTGSAARAIVKMSTDKILYAFRNTASPYYNAAQVLSITGTVISLGTILTIAEVGTFYAQDLVALDSTRALLVYTNATPYTRAIILTVTGTTVTAGTLLTVTTSVFYPECAFLIAADKVFVGGANAAYLMGIVLSVSGTVITANTLYTSYLSTSHASYTYGLQYFWAQITATEFVVLETKSTATIGYYPVITSVSGVTVSMYTPTDYEATIAKFEFIAASGMFKMLKLNTTTCLIFTKGNYSGTATGMGVIRKITIEDLYYPYFDTLPSQVKLADKSPGFNKPYFLNSIGLNSSSSTYLERIDGDIYAFLILGYLATPKIQIIRANDDCTVTFLGNAITSISPISLAYDGKLLYIGNNRLAVFLKEYSTSNVHLQLYSFDALYNLTFINDTIIDASGGSYTMISSFSACIDSSKLLLCYTRESSVVALVINIDSSDNVTVGSETSLSGSYGFHFTGILLNSNQVLLRYSMGTSSYTGYILVLTINGNMISQGTQLSFGSNCLSGNTKFVLLDKFYLCFTRTGGPLTYYVFEVSGSTVSLSSSGTVAGSAPVEFTIQAVKMSDKKCIVFMSSDSLSMQYVVFTINSVGQLTASSVTTLKLLGAKTVPLAAETLSIKDKVPLIFQSDFKQSGSGVQSVALTVVDFFSYTNLNGIAKGSGSIEDVIKVLY